MSKLKKVSKAFLLALLFTTIIPRTIHATEMPEAEISETEVVTKNIITGFEEIDSPLDSFHISKVEKLSLSELKSMMPDALNVYINGNKESIEVDWISIGEEYDNSEAYYYQFSPIWDEEKYELSEDYNLVNDVPYISVFLHDDSFSKARAVTNNSNETTIYNFLKKEMGLNTAAACGVLANIYHESSFNPNATGDKGTSYGICQWHNERWDAMKTWCSKNGYNWKNLIGQLNYLKFELSKNDYRYLYNGKTVYEKISTVENSIEGAYWAGYYWCYYYEVPANREKASATRGNLAKNTYWAGYNIKPGVSNVSVNSSTSVTETVISWTDASYADTYNLYIEKYINGSYELYETKKNLKDTIYSKILPAGDYSAYVVSCNGDNETTSERIEFAVDEEISVNISTGDSFSKTTFSWNTVPGASEYELYILKNESEHYFSPYVEIMNLSTNNYSCTLPTGEYSVYVCVKYADKEDYIESILKQFTINKCKHAKTVLKNVVKATTKKNGSTGDKYCSVCNECLSKGNTIYYPKTITLSTSSYTYNGKEKKPSAKIKDSKGNTISSNNYTVKYASGRKNVGKYSVKITFKGNYSGSITKCFTINPKSTSISKLTKHKKGFTVKWKKISTQVTGYQIQYCTNKSFKSNVKSKYVSSYKTTSKKITGLKSKKTYYIRVRTYKTVKGAKFYSSWSKVKSVKTK